MNREREQPYEVDGLAPSMQKRHASHTGARDFVIVPRSCVYRNKLTHHFMATRSAASFAALKLPQPVAIS